MAEWLEISHNQAGFQRALRILRFTNTSCIALGGKRKHIQLKQEWMQIVSRCFLSSYMILQVGVSLLQGRLCLFQQFPHVFLFPNSGM